jgi:hypothetical protein
MSTKVPPLQATLENNELSRWAGERADELDTSGHYTGM